MRDKLGRFVVGHKPLVDRDKTTGRFIPIKTMEKPNNNSMADIEKEINKILREKGLGEEVK